MYALWRGLCPCDGRNLYIALTAPLVGLAAWRTIRVVLDARVSSDQGILTDVLESPLRTQTAASPTVPEPVPYPSNAMPGARDIDTPYGSIRIYEWGPEDGRKVLFVHGISTPSVALGALAQQLVDQGCRVMLFDLFGRGYSDAPDPSRCVQDLRLFTSQILLVLASSPLSWTGRNGRFALVGYSLGGGIAASFAAHFSHLVRSLILIAPSGLLRPSRFAQSGRLVARGLLPEWVVETLVRRRLKQNNFPAEMQDSSPLEENAVDPADLVQAELPSMHPALTPDSKQVLWPGRVNGTVSDVVMWQLNTHRGFIKSFVSSMRHAPIMDQHPRWAQIARGQDDTDGGNSTTMKEWKRLDERKILLLLGTKDDVIDHGETMTDAVATMGPARVKVVSLEADHGIPTSHAQECASAIFHFWDEG